MHHDDVFLDEEFYKKQIRDLKNKTEIDSVNIKELSRQIELNKTNIQELKKQTETDKHRIKELEDQEIGKTDVVNCNQAFNDLLKQVRHKIIAIKQNTYLKAINVGKSPAFKQKKKANQCSNFKICQGIGNTRDSKQFAGHSR